MANTSEILLTNEDKDLKISNAAWADAINKILKTKQQKGKSLVLSKAKLISENVINKIKQENDDIENTFEIVDKCGQKVVNSIKVEISQNEKPELENRKSKIPNRIRIRDQVLMGRQKPSVSGRLIEKKLSNLATKGVVQLFNMVKQQQRTVEKKLKKSGPSILKQDKALESIDKKSFIDSIHHNKLENDECTWNVLRDDFMGGAKIKDWDIEIKNDDEFNV